MQTHGIHIGSFLVIGFSKKPLPKPLPLDSFKTMCLYQYFADFQSQVVLWILYPVLMWFQILMTNSLGCLLHICSLSISAGLQFFPSTKHCVLGTICIPRWEAISCSSKYWLLVQPGRAWSAQTHANPVRSLENCASTCNRSKTFHTLLASAWGHSTAPQHHSHAWQRSIPRWRGKFSAQRFPRLTIFILDHRNKVALYDCQHLCIPNDAFPFLFFLSMQQPTGCPFCYAMLIKASVSLNFSHASEHEFFAPPWGAKFLGENRPSILEQ